MMLVASGTHKRSSAHRHSLSVLKLMVVSRRGSWLFELSECTFLLVSDDKVKFAALILVALTLAPSNRTLRCAKDIVLATIVMVDFGKLKAQQV